MTSRTKILYHYAIKNTENENTKLTLDHVESSNLQSFNLNLSIFLTNAQYSFP